MQQKRSAPDDERHYGWQLTRCLFVGDAGMVSQANLQTLSKGGGKYLLAMPMRRGDEVTEEVLSCPGRYRSVAENLQVKEVIVGEGERRRRYAVCFNPLESKRQKAHREELLNELEAELASLADLTDGSHTKRMCALRSSARYGRLLKEAKRGLAIDRQAVDELERFDGKFVVHSRPCKTLESRKSTGESLEIRHQKPSGIAIIELET